MRSEALTLLRRLKKLKVRITASLSDESGRVSPLRSTKTLKLKD